LTEKVCLPSQSLWGGKRQSGGKRVTLGHQVLEEIRRKRERWGFADK
jgi:hypothetical protein